MNTQQPIQKDTKEGYSGRFMPMVRQAADLKADQELPVIFTSLRELRSAQATANQQGYATRSKGFTLYISKRGKS